MTIPVGMRESGGGGELRPLRGKAGKGRSVGNGGVPLSGGTRMEGIESELLRGEMVFVIWGTVKSGLGDLGGGEGVIVG